MPIHKCRHLNQQNARTKSTHPGTQTINHSHNRGYTKKFRFPVQKAEVKVSNEYEVFPECISNKGRGITIQVHTSLNAQEVKLTTKFEESVWCEVKLSKYKKLLIGCVYRSESGSSGSTPN